MGGRDDGPGVGHSGLRGRDGGDDVLQLELRRAPQDLVAVVPQPLVGDVPVWLDPLEPGDSRRSRREHPVVDPCGDVERRTRLNRLPPAVDLQVDRAVDDEGPVLPLADVLYRRPGRSVGQVGEDVGDLVEDREAERDAPGSDGPKVRRCDVHRAPSCDRSRVPPDGLGAEA